MRLKLRYDGWLALPASLRAALGLGTGGELEAGPADGAFVPRPSAASARLTADAAPQAEGASAAATARRQP